MSDVFPPSNQSSTPGIVYTVSTQYVKDLSFENPRAPHIFAQAANQTPQVTVSVSVAGQKLSETLYEIVLDITAEAKQGEEIAFLAELSYAGVVLARGDVPQTHLEPLLMIEVPRMLFPFARAILSSATRDGGFPPLLLAPVDFEALYKQQQAAAAEKAAAPA